jgi:SagB-type dehydrogenase family enzyme
MLRQRSSVVAPVKRSRGNFFWRCCVLMSMAIGLIACQEARIEPTQATENEISETILLPDPRRDGPVSLEQALAGRRSLREFDDEPLTLEQISQLLWAGQGVTDPAGYRTAPSAGALYPLELYLLTGEGLYRYDPDQHALHRLRDEDLRSDLYDAALEQKAVLEAPICIAVTAVYGRTAGKYGVQRSPRYVHLEAGHAAQNILLQAVVLGLGAVPIGAFYDDRVQATLDLPADHDPLYLIPIGRPR